MIAFLQAGDYVLLWKCAEFHAGMSTLNERSSKLVYIGINVQDGPVKCQNMRKETDMFY